MNHLLDIWPSLGRGHQKTTRNLSWTKSGPGRRHSKLRKRVVEAIIKARSQGFTVDPTTLVGA